jgi:ornithine cyclodeaminase/alanine dehydrogenase-like protein (mu-crystallin family)
MNERSDKSKKSVKKMAASYEKPTGEWNTMEVYCKANTITVYVNGVLQNKATGVSASSGYICLQSEGKDIEFRNVYLTRNKK